ncbi:augmin complex subunit wac [Episyrphus balteatus]|uniref:augmin complex subunit wac n=1 Tax=Episyrphus balteatus TaxID=286459 RepID=UPI002486BB08|nr:augmin complex subunit wac [Episyrphus balteatus]
MDTLHTFEEVSALKKLREEYERQLKMFGVELCDLPDDCMTKLNECIQLKMATKLHDLSINYLKEFYYTRKKEQIDQRLAITKIQTDINDLEKQIEAETLELDQLQMFTTLVNKRLMSEAEMENNKVSIDKKMQDMIARQKSFMIPEDINIDELIRKIELLESRKKNTKNT